MFYIALAIIENAADVEKFGEIYAMYAQMMYRVAFSVLKDVQYAEDATQEAFLKLAKNISKIGLVSCRKTESFLVILSRSVSIDMYRKLKTGAIQADFDKDNDEAISELLITQDILEEVISDESYKNLVGYIEELGDVYKDAIKLKFIHELKNDEIAEILNISKKNVEARITRGKARLIERLKKEGYYVGRK